MAHYFINCESFQFHSIQSEVPRCRVNWKISSTKAYDRSIGRYVSKRVLNDHYTIMCVWMLCPNAYLRPDFVKIQRECTTGVLKVDGTFLVSQDGQFAVEKHFAEVIGSGASFAIIKLNLPNRSYALVSHQPNFSFRGNVKILHIPSEEHEKDIQLQSLKKLSNDFEHLLEPQTSCFADLTFKCGTASIPAHKVILSARSPVFATMFANPMKESRENKVYITDMDVSVLQAMLMYMYTGKISDLTVSLASDLLFASDKYQLPDLKKICSDFLKCKICLQNVLKILVLGDLHCEGLKLFALDYICSEDVDFSLLKDTEEWEILEIERPSLVMDILSLKNLGN